MDTPQSLVPHEAKYKQHAWEQYTLAELGWWVHLLVTRSQHRLDEQRRLKDLQDAQNYLDMMQAKLYSVKEIKHG